MSRLLNFFEASLVIFDLNPLVSEPLRFGSLFIAQATLHNILISGLVFGGVTLLLDVLGSIAAADLLTKDQATNILIKTSSLLQKIGLKRLLDLKTNLSIDFAITLLVGTPVALVLKQWQEPSRGYHENVRYAVLLSAAAALIAALQGSAIVAGIWHPNSLDITVALVAILSLIIIPPWLKRRLS